MAARGPEAARSISPMSGSHPSSSEVRTGRTDAPARRAMSAYAGHAGSTTTTSSPGERSADVAR